MITWLKKLLWDESAFTRYARALALGAASAWNYWSIEGSLTKQGIIGSVIIGFGGLMGAGEKNEPTLATKNDT